MTNVADESTQQEILRPEKTSWVPELVERFIEAPLMWHVLAVLLVLIAGLGATRSSEVWTSDEGAVRFQVELLATDGSWSAERPFAELDPEEITSPIHASTIVGDRYAPYTKHPLLPLLLVPLRNLAGDRALVLPSLFGTIVAAAVGALIAGAIERRIRNVTLWVLALGTPLFFYTYTVLAHTLATALAGIAVLVVIRSGERASTQWIIAIVAVFGAVLLRAEAAAFGMALAVAVVFAQSKVRWATKATLSSVLVLATTSAAVVNRFWAISVGSSAPVSEGQGIFEWVRLVSGIFSSTMLTDFGSPMLLIVVFLMVGGVALLVLSVEREPDNLWLQRALAGASVVGSIALLVIMPEPVGGVLAATPVLVAGLVLIRTEHTVDPRIRVLLITSAVFAAGVFATQDRGGGGAQWGGRYLMLALPGVVPIAILTLRSLFLRRPSARVTVVGLLVAMSLTLSMDATVVLQTGRENSANLAAKLSGFGREIDAADTRPVIISSRTHIGRRAWRTIQVNDYLLIPYQEFDEYAKRMAETGIEEFGVVSGWSDDRSALFTSLGYEALNLNDEPFLVMRRIDP